MAARVHLAEPTGRRVAGGHGGSKPVPDERVFAVAGGQAVEHRRADLGLHRRDSQVDDRFTVGVHWGAGATDTAIPEAKDTPGSPIYGMPIINSDEAANIVFLKHSVRPGFDGIDSELLFDEKTPLLPGDAKDSCPSWSQDAGLSRGSARPLASNPYGDAIAANPSHGRSSLLVGGPSLCVEPLASGLQIP